METQFILAIPGYEYRQCKTNYKSIHEQIGDLENERHDAQLLPFPSLDGKEVECELQTVIVNRLSFRHDNLQTRFDDLLQLNIPPCAMEMQPECVQIELCDAIADVHLIKASEKIGSKHGYKAQ